jgi:hypothetical protein
MFILLTIDWSRTDKSFLVIEFSHWLRLTVYHLRLSFFTIKNLIGIIFKKFFDKMASSTVIDAELTIDPPENTKELAETLT